MAFFDDIGGFLSGVFLLLGCGFLLVGGIGMLRLGDFFARLHAASIIDTLGAGFFLIGLMFYGGFSLASGKLALILVFLLLTTPTAAHALAGAAHVMGIRPHGVEEDESGNEDVIAATPQSPRITPQNEGGETSIR